MTLKFDNDKTNLKKKEKLPHMIANSTYEQI